MYGWVLDGQGVMTFDHALYLVRPILVVHPFDLIVIANFDRRIGSGCIGDGRFSHRGPAPMVGDFVATTNTTSTMTQVAIGATTNQGKQMLGALLLHAPEPTPAWLESGPP